VWLFSLCQEIIRSRNHQAQGFVCLVACSWCAGSGSRAEKLGILLEEEGTAAKRMHYPSNHIGWNPNVMTGEGSAPAACI
jgi:hypothetical protein